MKELLHSMQMPLLSKPLPEVYTLKFDNKLEVNILTPHLDALDMIVHVGTSKIPAPESIIRYLLAMNCCRLDSFPFNVGMDPASGKVTLWLRHTLVALNIEKLTSFLKAALNHSAIVLDVLNGKTAANPLSAQ